jgi:beta-glucosidase
LEPGETVEVELTVAAADLGFWDVTRARHCVESARHSVMVGRSSTDLRLTTTLDVHGERIPPRTLDLAATSFDEYCGITLSDETTVSLEPQAWLAFHDVQLDSETAVAIIAANRGAGPATVDLRLDDPLQGELLSTVQIPLGGLTPITGELAPVTGVHTLYAVFSAADVVLESVTV